MTEFRIKKLSLEGFRGFKKSELLFPDSNILLLIGNNGKGKSSILDSIALLLSDFVKHITDENGKDNIIIQKTDINNSVQKTIIEGTFEAINEIFSIRLSSQLEFLKDITSKDAKKAYTEFVFKMKHAQVLPNYPILVYYKSNRFFKPAKELKLDLSSILSSEKTNTSIYSNALSSRDMTFEDFQTWFRFEEDIENDQIRRLKDFKKTNPKLEAIRMAIKSFFNNLEDTNRLFSELRVERVGAKSKLKIKKGFEDFEIAQLSDGERMLLLLICDVARRLTLANNAQFITQPLNINFLQGSGIVLIDEIDMHLHPKWQRNVLRAMTKTFPNIQFIATTHSPQVLSRVQRESVRVLDDGKILMISSNPIGRDANAILEEIQQVPKRPKEIETLIDSYYASINNNEFETANAFKNQLLVYLDSEDPVFARANAMIERKKMLMP